MRAWLFVFVVLATFFSSGEALAFQYDRMDLLRDMAALDRAYIPALSLTAQAGMEQAKRALDQLVDAWKPFLDRWDESNPEDPGWTGDLQEADRRIAEAVAAGGGPKAHEALEGVRKALWRLRDRNNFDYFPDFLTAFHDPMEEIVLAVQGKRASDLDQALRARLRTRFAQALGLWDKVREMDPDPSIFAFSAARSAEFRSLMDKETAALGALGKALEQGQPEEILHAAPAIKPPFSKVYMFFGDFSTAEMAP